MSELISANEAAKLIGISSRTISRWEKSNADFPKRIGVTKRVIRFKKSDIESYINKLIADQNAEI
jgi:predicted DNA-binding transcriptional regulator AlpA